MIYNGDCREILKTIETETINCCITSPPYYGLRDYGEDKQIGLENTPEKYIEQLADVFDEIKRVLKADGTLWLNIGDSYAGSGKGGANYPDNAMYYKQGTNTGSLTEKGIRPYRSEVIKPKDMIGIPWMLAFELRRRGWYLRQDIIWSKPNPMPESVKDRCTKSHEYIFLLSKSDHYYFDAEAIAEPVADSTLRRLNQNIDGQNGSFAYGKTNGNMKAVASRYGGKKYTEHKEDFFRTKSGKMYEYRAKRNKRDVWTVSTKAYKGAHFATFPEDLIEPCVLAGCPKAGIIIDPFAGTSTTGVVCKRYGREFIGIEINKEYCTMGIDRMKNVQMKMELR